MPDRVIRVATDADVAGAGVLTAEAYRADGLVGDSDDHLGELLDSARRAREATLLVALVPTETAPVGTVTCAPAGSVYAEIAEPGEVEVRMLAVAPAWRRQGIAEALTRAAMLEAVRLGARGVVLPTLEAMTGAHRLYRRLGFARVPARERHHENIGLQVYTWVVPRGPGLRIETAMWRPCGVRDVDGWRLGLSGGFTRRANSVVALAAPEDVPGSIVEVERIYAAHGLPPVFRVCAQSSPEGLDELLLERGYGEVSCTLVMVRERLDELAGMAELAAAAAAGIAAAHATGVVHETFGGQDRPEARSGISFVVTETPDEEWLSGWLAAKAGEPVDRRVAAAIVSGARAIYVRATNGGETVAVIRAALEQEWVGLSCLVVEPATRRAGIGRAITLEALRLAAGLRAERAFVQVAESNAPAIALYGQLGFDPADRYHYRER